MGELAVSLAVKYGPVAGEALYNLYKTWMDKKEITPEMWAEARAINARPIEFYEGVPSELAGKTWELRPSVNHT